jgi:2-polyprenyl-6-hydroxyphenyl methylase/3-demethylubiquinone-9 3-methyltransferase
MGTAFSNQDEAELAKFSALAHRWWDRNSEFKPLHDINPLRLNWIAEMTGGLSGKKVLDVGCGGGILSESMARSGAQVTGIDLAEKPLAVAKLHLLESGQQVEYRKVSVEDLAAECPATFDVVTCMEMMEHVPNPASVVKSCQALVKPGGAVFFSTLNRNPKSWLFAIVGAEYILKLLPKGTHQWDKFIKPSELCQMARAAGLNLGQLKGMSYHPLRGEYSLGQDVSVNYLMHCQRP